MHFAPRCGIGWTKGWWAMNVLWVAMLVAGVLAAAWQGDVSVAGQAAVAGAARAIDLVLDLAAGLMLWLGLLALVRESGLLARLAQVVAPLLARLFPDLDRGGAAFGGIVLNFCANLLGLGNAATPFGVSAMKELARQSPTPGVASDDMITLLLLNTTAPTLLPTTVIALRAAAGAENPAELVPISLAAALVGLAVGLLAHRLLIGRR